MTTVLAAASTSWPDAFMAVCTPLALLGGLALLYWVMSR